VISPFAFRAFRVVGGLFFALQASTFDLWPLARLMLSLHSDAVRIFTVGPYLSNLPF